MDNSVNFSDLIGFEVGFGISIASPLGAGLAVFGLQSDGTCIRSSIDSVGTSGVDLVIVVTRLGFLLHGGTFLGYAVVLTLLGLDGALLRVTVGLEGGNAYLDVDFCLFVFGLGEFIGVLDGILIFGQTDQRNSQYFLIARGGIER